MCIGYNALITWDHQTGVQVGKSSIETSTLLANSITYSGCGTMFGVLFKGAETTIIGTYNMLSKAPIYHHSIKGLVVGTIWVHGECLQFATLRPETITIWKVGFASEHPPIEIKSLHTPSNFDLSKVIYSRYIFLPTLLRLAFCQGHSAPYSTSWSAASRSIIN